MKVAHICARFGAISEVCGVYDPIRMLGRLGLETIVVTANRENPDLFPMEGVVEVCEPTRWSPQWIWSKMPRALRVGWRSWPQTALRRASRAIREFDPDVLHAHFGHVGAASVPLAERLALPLVVSCHGADVFQIPRDPRWKAQYRTMFESGARLTVVSEFGKQELIRLGCSREKTAVIHAGIDPGAFSFREPRRNGEPVRMVSVGRMVEKKGLPDALRALSLVLKRGVEIELTLVGDGPERPRVVSLIRSLGLGSAVSVAGEAKRADVVRVLMSSDIFLLASRTARNGDREGIPGVLLEAQSIGLPVVSTTHSGIPEGIPEANRRFLAPEGDPESLADRILRLVEERESWGEIARLGRSHVEANFDLETEAKKLVNLYEQAVGRAPE